MIKLKPIAEHILQEAEETVTWGEVKQAFEAIVGKQNKAESINSLKKLGKFGLSFIPGVDLISKVLDLYDNIEDAKDVASALLSLGKSVSNKELKNPKGSEFKAMTGPFWEAIKISPELSILLDDKIEKQFIDQIILPKLQDAGAESEELPNMDEELGKWLNSMGLKDNADVHFKGASGDL